MALAKDKMAEVLQILAKMDEKDLSFAEEIIKSRQSALTEVQVARFPIGTRVTVNYPRGEQNVDGVVQKINKLTIVVRGDDGKVHRVGPDVLTLKQMAVA